MNAVLFVDDNQVLCRLSCDILRMEGYRAVGAYNAQEALEKLERERFDVVVTDLRMEGMDGLQLAHAIHNKHPKLPIIMVTAYEPVESKYLKACLPKERMFPTLLRHIQDCLTEAHPPDASPKARRG